MPFLKFAFSIEGRVRRREFFLFCLVMGAVFLNWLAGLRDIAANARVYTNTATDGYILHLLTYSETHYAFLALLVLITYTVVAKRLHDRGKSGWWQMLVFVPVVGALWLAVELFILPGSSGDNKYGPHPTFNPEGDKGPLRVR
jgi:uncharacterized membrane protein YhaH (DUF805 family)